MLSRFHTRKRLKLNHCNQTKNNSVRERERENAKRVLEIECINTKQKNKRNNLFQNNL